MSGVSPTNRNPNSSTKSDSKQPTETVNPTNSAPIMPDKVTPSIPLKMATDTIKVKNPYLLKWLLAGHKYRTTKPSDFLIILSEYMTIILTHDKDQ